MSSIGNVKFNTRKKAQKCLELLGKRGLYSMSIIYKGEESG